MAHYCCVKSERTFCSYIFRTFIWQYPIRELIVPPILFNVPSAFFMTGFMITKSNSDFVISTDEAILFGSVKGSVGNEIIGYGKMKLNKHYTDECWIIFLQQLM